MALLKGTTLGEKHQTYNQILKELIAEGSKEVTKINYNEDDIDNMMKIDIACNYRNVDYIMEVLKCDDMLYVTRAIKHSVWLITDPEYAHFIHPDYLESNVFPEMRTRAVTKLMLHIRRYFKDEKRSEDFFYYVENKNPMKALKWLENCSLLFTEKIVAKYANSIPVDILRRLCKKSVNILEIYANNINGRRRVPFEKVMFLLKSNTEEFLNIAEKQASRRYYTKPSFTEKQTEILMKRSFQRIINNFTFYENNIHLPTFVVYLNKASFNIKTFLLTYCNNSWMNFNNLKPFLITLNNESNVELIKELYKIKNDDDDDSEDSNYTENSEREDDDGASNRSDTKTNYSSDVDRTEVENIFYKIEPNYNKSSEVYRWYEFTPFEIAFEDLSNFIKTEPSTEMRHVFMIILAKNASKNMEFIRKVLKYYLKEHINEPLINRIQFLNSVMSDQDAFRFDEETWNILDNIFHRCNVYIKSSYNVQNCLITIIVRSVLLTISVHPIVEEKFIFDTLVDVKKKLNNIEKDKLFDYLFKLQVKKLNNQEITTEVGMKKATALLVNLWTLLKDWKKEETHHKFVIDRMFQLCNKQITGDKLKYLYCAVKPYHKPLFEKSLLFYPCEEMCINALKHDPSLLERYQTEVTALCCNDNVSLKTLFSKLRIYWPKSLVTKWRCTLTKHLQEFSGHKALVRNIFVLSSQQQLLDFIKKYAPNENKISWNETVLIEVNLRKHIAKWMHLARPYLPVEVVLWYAKGDYLQFTHHSLNSIYCNLRSQDIDNYINLLLNSPVSLQKHGIRLASMRMKTDELLKTFPIIWKSTKNISIRAHLFISAFKILCDVENANFVCDSWEVLRYMIDNLHKKENKKIYYTLANIRDVPLSIVGAYYEKVFLFLKDMPERICDAYNFERIKMNAKDLIQYINPVFVENTLLISAYDIFSQENYEYLNILSAYLLCSKDESTQMQKYKNELEPLFTICVPKWKAKEYESSIINSFKKFIKYTINYLDQFQLNITILPIKMLNQIFSILESKLCKEEHYTVITRWKLSIAYVQLLNDYRVFSDCSDNNIKTWEEISRSTIEKYGKICIKYLKEDIDSYFPSVYMLFAEQLNKVCKNFNMDRISLLSLYDNMLVCENLEVYMLVLNLFQRNNFDYDDSRHIAQVTKKNIFSFSSGELRIHCNAQCIQNFDDCEDSKISENVTGSDPDVRTSSSEEGLSDVEDGTESHQNMSWHR